MKHIFTLLFILFVTVLGFCQDRVEISGQLSVPSSTNAEGITIYNSGTSKGEVTNAYGKFTIDVGLNDKLVFSSLQFREFTVVIDEGVINTKQLNVQLSQAVNQLDEVIVRPYDLSGNVAVAIQYIDVDAGGVFEIDSKSIVYGYDYDFTDDTQTRVDNSAQKSLVLENGLNIKNIIKLFFKKKDRKENTRETALFEADVNVRKSYNDTFFTQQLGIEPKNINSFIYYAQDKGLTSNMLEKGRELELIEFLFKTSKTYKAARD